MTKSWDRDDCWDKKLTTYALAEIECDVIALDEWFTRKDGSEAHNRWVAAIQIGAGIVGIAACVICPEAAGEIGVMSVDSGLTGGKQLITGKYEESVKMQVIQWEVNEGADFIEKHTTDDELATKVHDEHFRHLIATVISQGVDTFSGSPLKGGAQAIRKHLPEKMVNKMDKKKEPIEWGATAVGTNSDLNRVTGGYSDMEKFYENTNDDEIHDTR